MNAMYVGIDISKLSIDVYIPIHPIDSIQGSRSKESKEIAIKLENTQEGFSELLTKLPSESHCIMEATGGYHLALAHFLNGKGIKLSVINPLSSRNFARMRMQRTKTDKMDAASLSQYGRSNADILQDWQPSGEHLVKIRQEMGLVEQLIKQKTALGNQKDSFMLSPVVSAKAIETIDTQIETLKEAISELDKSIQKHIKDNHPDMFDNLTSIPGIGPKTATMLLVLSKGFVGFETYRQFIAYVGLCPKHYISGTTVRGQTHICKMGLAHMRQLLYLCALQAKKCNKPCHDLFVRLSKAGKPFKVAMVAVANKLIKQAFAIARSNMPFEPNFQYN